jgi:hypothetical protein
MVHSCEEDFQTRKDREHCYLLLALLSLELLDNIIFKPGYFLAE